MLNDYVVTGLYLAKGQPEMKFKLETKAVSVKQAVNNVRYRLMRANGYVELRDVDTLMTSVDREINLFEPSPGHEAFKIWLEEKHKEAM